MFSFFSQPKGQQPILKQKQPELPENKTIWESDNQGVKEETFIRTGRRGGDGQLVQRGIAAGWQLEDQKVPHLHADKPEGTPGE